MPTIEVDAEEWEAAQAVIRVARNARWSIAGLDEALSKLDEVRARFRCPMSGCRQTTKHGHGCLMTERWSR